MAAELLKEGKSVAVGETHLCCVEADLTLKDNTNPDKDIRKSWISLAQKYGIPISCLHFTADRQLARHNAIARALSGNTEVDAKTPGSELGFLTFIDEPRGA